jgi:hypothetical protein
VLPVFCIRNVTLLPQLQRLLPFCPSRRLPVLWLLLTSHDSAIRHRMGWLSPLVRPPRVRTMTFTSRTCHIYAVGFGQYWISFCPANSSAPLPPYVIPVRQAEVLPILRNFSCSAKWDSEATIGSGGGRRPLPKASFRFRLATDTLAFS